MKTKVKQFFTWFNAAPFGLKASIMFMVGFLFSIIFSLMIYLPLVLFAIVMIVALTLSIIRIMIFLEDGE